MKQMLMTSAAVLATILLAAPVYSGQRHGGGAAGGGGHAVSRPGGSIGRAVPRAGAPVRPPIAGPYRSYGNYRYPYYYPRFGLGLHYGYPGYYGLGYAWYGYPYYGYPYYGYGYGYGYGYPGSITAAPGRGYGRVRIQNAPRDAQVFVDGNYAGIFDDIDAARAGLSLEAGVHRIEIRAPGFETIVFDVNLLPRQTIAYRAHMQPLQP